jgi:cellulose synthase/poly-beta-1,6-N-acetylglucosamine synthase-like glycosyltransferase
MQVIVWAVRLLVLAGELVLAIPLAYLTVLSVAALLAGWRLRRQRRRRGTHEDMAAADRRPHFAILIPAHDEAGGIAHVLQSIAALDYPHERCTAIVVADNCSDATARIARATGADVYERFDEQEQAKGYALRWLWGQLEREGRRFDAYAIVDADSRLAAGFLLCMAEALAGGAGAAQGQYRVLNGDDGWAAGLRAVAIALFNHLRPLGRSLFGWSAGLKGNGMVFSRAVMERFGWESFALAEDAEQHLRLIDAGIRVRYVPEAVVSAEMPATLKSSTSQQKRWERGRFDLARTETWPLVRGFLRTGDTARLDVAMELALPPLSLVVGAVVCCCALAGALRWGPTLWLALGLVLALSLHMAAGAALARLSVRTYLSLLRAPLYVVWKCWVYAAALASRGSLPWVRTQRANAK